MAMAKRILVPLSRVTPAGSFLTALGDLARAAGASVRLLHVAPVPNSLMDEDGRVVAYADQERFRVEAEAHDFLETISLALGTDAIESTVRFGDPVEEILAEADDFAADLIALAADGLRRFHLVGGIAEQLFRRSDAPVALVRAGRHEGAAA
jgi:nucleotide-binding universal stress UspA family protein